METYIQYYNDSLNDLNKKARKNIFFNDNQIQTLTVKQYIILCYDILITNFLIYSCKRLYRLPWNIIFVDNQLENGYPHTHYDTIFMPINRYFSLSKHERIKLLIHEKFHVYQRYYPIEFNKMLFNEFDLKVETLLKEHKDFENIRMNPDLNNLIYSDQGEYYLQNFRENAYSLADSTKKVYNETTKNTKYKQLYPNEHPYETFAYYISDLIVNKKRIDEKLLKYM